MLASLRETNLLSQILNDMPGFFRAHVGLEFAYEEFNAETNGTVVQGIMQMNIVIGKK